MAEAERRPDDGPGYERKVEGAQQRNVVGPGADGELRVEGCQHDADGRHGISRQTPLRPLGPGQVGEQTDRHERAPPHPEQRVPFRREGNRGLAARQQDAHCTEQHARAYDDPPVPVAAGLLHRLHRQIEPARPCFEQHVVRMLFFTRPEGFSEGVFVPFRLQTSVETFETGRISDRHFDVIFQRHGRLVVRFVRNALPCGASALQG